MIRQAGAVPSFKGYHGFPGSICSSVNDVVVHGIPSSTVILAEGDLVSIDCGAILDGWHGDSAWTFGVGELSQADAELSEATRLSMEAGIAAMIDGARLTDISHAIETGTHDAERKFDRAFGIVDGYGGHGIGREMHMEPFLANEGAPGSGPCSSSGRPSRSSRCSPWARPRQAFSTTTGRSSPTTARVPHIGSTPWPSPPTGRESSPTDRPDLSAQLTAATRRIRFRRRHLPDTYRSPALNAAVRVRSGAG